MKISLTSKFTLKTLNTEMMRRLRCIRRREETMGSVKSKRKANMCFRMVQYTTDSGRETKDMAMEFKSGLMGPSMKDIGKIIRLMEKEYSIT